MDIKTIAEIIKSIESEDILLPDFQRGYVWKISQVEKYFSSLYKSYPTGSLIMWSAPKEYLKRNFDKISEANLILDGQQRVTTLFMVYTGKRPHWIDDERDIPSLYFELENECFKVIKKYDKDKHKNYVGVRDVYRYGIEEFIKSSRDEDYLLQYHDRLEKLANIVSYKYHVSVVAESNVSEIVEMFNALNSEGTRLSETDLALALMVITWPEAKREISRLVSKYKYLSFDFGKDFMVRLLNIISCDKAKYSDLKFISSARLESGCRSLEKSLDYIISIWSECASVQNSTLFSSLHPFLIIAYFISKNRQKFDNEKIRDKVIFYSFIAMIWGRYSGATEATLERDVKTIREKNSFEPIIQEIAQHRGNQLYVTTEDVKKKNTSATIFRLMMISILARKPYDWIDTSLPLVTNNTGKTYSIEYHHIFPKNLLKRIIPASSDADFRVISGQIANIALITSITNKSISDGGPSLYLKNVPLNELQNQYIPEDQTLWSPDYESYNKFIDERARLIRDGINAFLKQYYPDFRVGSSEESKIWSDKIREFESKMRSIISERFKNSGKTIEQFLGEVIYDKMSKRVSGYNRVNPLSSQASRDDDASFINYLEMGDYHNIIASEHNWGQFSEVFIDPRTFKQRFYKISNLRNLLYHNRELDVITVKDCEASFLWFENIFAKYDLSKLPEKTTNNFIDNKNSYVIAITKLNELKKELLDLDNKIWVQYDSEKADAKNSTSEKIIFKFSPSEWGMSEKNFPPLIFDVKILHADVTSELMAQISIDFLDVFKKNRREDFLSEINKNNHLKQLSFLEFDVQSNYKLQWVARKKYKLDELIEKLTSDYVELSDFIYAIGNLLRGLTTRDGFSSPVSFF